MGSIRGQSHPVPPPQFQAAVAAQEKGDNATAIRLYRDLLRRNPGAQPARVNLCGLLVEADVLDEAIALYRAGLKLAPSSKDLHAGLALALGRRGKAGDLKLAIAELQPLHRKDPEDDQISMLLADAYTRESRFTEALPLLAVLERRHPQDRDIAWLTGLALIRSGNPGEGLRRIDAVAATDGSAEAFLLAGEARLSLQQFDLAQGDAEAALRKDANLTGAQVLLGRALEHSGDYPAAEAALRKGLQGDPKNFEANFYLGALLYFQRNLQEAAEYLRRALQTQPEAAEARYKLALTEQAQGQQEAALQDLQRVAKERPEWLEPHAKLAAMFFALHRNAEAAQMQAEVERIAARQAASSANAP